MGRLRKPLVTIRLNACLKDVELARPAFRVRPCVHGVVRELAVDVETMDLFQFRIFRQAQARLHHLIEHGANVPARYCA